MKINTDPTALANSFYEIHAPMSPRHESDRRLFGEDPERDAWIDIHTNRFADTDTYQPYDLSKNPSALYAYENGFDIIFPAQTLSELGKTAMVAASGSLINTPAAAETVLASLDDTDPYKDEVRSNLALHYLYAENYEGANRLMHSIGDIALATHVMAHMVKENEEKGLVGKTEQEDLIDQLREKAASLTKVSDVYQVPVIEEAADALRDKDVAKASVKVRKHRAKLETRKSRRWMKSIEPVTAHPEVKTDGTVKTDMAAILAQL